MRPSTLALHSRRGAAPPRRGNTPNRTPTTPPSRLPRPPRTSEFWYDDEEEFDAIAGDSLRAKAVTVVVGGGEGAAAAVSSSTRFDACFHAPGAAAAASALWAGRPEAGPPFFIKARARPALETDPEAAWTELASQNWRASALQTGLDAATTAAAEGAPENLLVVLEDGEGFLGAAGVAPSPGGGTTVTLSSWTGDGVAPLPTWRSLVVEAR